MYLLIGKTWNSLGHNDHIQTYCIYSESEYCVKKIDDLPNYAPIHRVVSPEDGDSYACIYL